MIDDFVGVALKTLGPKIFTPPLPLPTSGLYARAIRGKQAKKEFKTKKSNTYLWTNYSSRTTIKERRKVAATLLLTFITTDKEERAQKIDNYNATDKHFDTSINTLSSKS